MIWRAVALGIAAVVSIAGGLAAAWSATQRRLASVGPTSMLEEEFEAWAQEQAFTSLLPELAPLLLTTGLVAAVGALVILAARAAARVPRRDRPSRGTR